MKKRTLIVENKEKKHRLYVKLGITIVLVILCIFLIASIIRTYLVNEEFSDSIAEISKMNTKTVFSIDRIYLYSSADANSNETNKPVWDLEIFQFTEIALYINNRDEDGVTYENTIKELKIDNVNFTGLSTGTPKLYYKNVNNFAKFNQEENEENEITDEFEFNIINSGEADYTSPVLYSNCQNPITLEYVNSAMKEETVISDISTALIYDGSLLKKAGILLSKIECTVSFRITIINNYNQKFIATVYIDIPLEDDSGETTIYDGSITKDMENTNLVKFVRVE